MATQLELLDNQRHQYKEGSFTDFGLKEIKSKSSNV